MNKQELADALNTYGVSFNKIRFFNVSPYRKRRYKPEYVGWEAWIYQNTSPCGYLITQEDWDNQKYRMSIIDTIKIESK